MWGLSVQFEKQLGFLKYLLIINKTSWSSSVTSPRDLVGPGLDLDWGEIPYILSISVWELKVGKKGTGRLALICVN